MDADKDGYGFQCDKGDDCDDTNATLHEDCGCTAARSGCACEDGTPPLDCTVSKKLSETGSLLCKTGKRYCRDSVWTDCIGVRSFALPPPDTTMSKLQQGIIKPDAGAKICDVCAPECYGVSDLLETVNDDDLSPGDTGGITLTPSTGAMDMTSPDTIDPTPGCTPGVIVPQFGQYDNDCDGIPDNFDNLVGMPGKTPPFVTDHTAIAMDLAPGETGSNTFELTFVLKTVDVYFLLDTTASMDGELNQLIKDLTTGTFLDDPSTAANEANNIVCASPLGQTTSDATLKTKGIAGNIACVVPNAAFGAGLFREIPFDNKDANGFSHAYDWFIPFEHRQDISTDVSKSLSALKLFYTAGNVSWPEDDIYALYAVATGSQIYTGWDRPGTEAKKCANNTDYFGYPCFRKEALPVVVLITDASLMNGPDVDVYKNSALSTCVTTTSPFTITATACTTDTTCQTTYNDKNYFCDYALGTGGTLTGKCAVAKAIASTCTADGLPDGVNDDNYKQPVNYATVQTNTLSKGTDTTYHAVSGNEDFSTAYDVGTIDTSLVTYVGDTRGMAADITAANFGAACSQWPTSGNAAATSSTTPGYPDAVFKFTVTDPTKTLTISTAGSNHAPTLGIISTGNAGLSSSASQQLTAPASSDSTPWTFAASNISGNFDYSVAVDLSSGFTGQWRRAAFGTCMDGAPNASDLGPDAIFAFTPDSDMNDVSFSVGGSQTVATNDTAANAAPWGNLGSSLGQTLTYYGTTSATTTTNKWGSASLGAASCRSNTTTANREHVLKFTLASAAKLELRLAAPSTYDPVISVFGPSSSAPVAGSTIANPKACNHNAGGDDIITSASGVTGATSVGGAFAAGTYYVVVHAYATTNTAGTYTLTLRELTDEAIVLYDQAPSTPTDYTIAGHDGPNSNDTFFNPNDPSQDEYNIGIIDGQSAILNAGDTSGPKIHADFLPSSFQQAQGNCTDVTGMSNDAVIEFSVGSTRTVRLETFDGTGATSDESAGFDHALAIVERPATLQVTPQTVTNNDATANARVVTAASIPAVIGGYTQLVGATYANANTVPMSPSISPLVMYDPAIPDSATCSAVTSDLQDVVYRFDVDAANAGYYDFDTAGSVSTTFLSLHSGSPDALTTVTPSVANKSNPATNDTLGSSSPSGAQTGVFLGSADGKTLTYSDTTTTATSNKWSDSNFPTKCRLNPANPLANQAHEEVISFSLSATRTISITASQTSPFDASLALFNTPPIANQNLPADSASGFKGCTRILGDLGTTLVSQNPVPLTKVANGIITGSLPAGTYYLVVYGSQGTNNTGSWSVSIADMTTRQAQSVTSQNSTANGSASIAGVLLGDVRGSQVTYNGATSSSTANKWTAAQAAASSYGAVNGCRNSAADDAVREQVLKFVVGTGSSGATNRNLSLTLTRSASTFDPVMAVYYSSATSTTASNTDKLAVSADLSSSIIGCQRAYVVNTPSAAKTFTNPVMPAPAVSATGDATNGGTITGTFAPGTYFVVVNGASATTNTYGNYTLTITDNTNDTPATVSRPLASGESSPNNFSDSILGSAGGTGTNTPYYDVGTLSYSGFAYTGAISSSTQDKWTGNNLGGTSNCQSSTTSSRHRSEHVFKVSIPANTSGKVALNSTFSSSSSGVIAYYDGANISTGIPQIGKNLGVPSSCALASSSTTGTFTINNGTSSAKDYWILVYPSSASSGTTYTGPYTLTITVTPSLYATANLKTGGNFSDTLLNTSISGDAPYLDFGTLNLTNTISYAGTTGASTPTKWTNTQLGAASPRTTTAGTANNAVPEHLFRFTTTSATAMTISVAGSSSQQVALSVFQSSGIPQTHTALAGLSNAQTSNNASSSASVSGTYNGTYYVMVQGTKNGQYGSYTLSLAPQVTATGAVSQSFTNSSLNSNATTTVTTTDKGSTFNAATLNGNDNTYGAYQYFGTASATQGFTYTSTVYGAVNKWNHGAILTSNDGTNGCRKGGKYDNNVEHAFRVTLNGGATVQLDTTSGSFDGVLTVFGPLTGSGVSWGSNVPKNAGNGGSTPSSAFNNGGGTPATSYCSRVNVSTGSTVVSTPGDYIIIVHSYDDSKNPNSNSAGAYKLSITPSAVSNYGDFGDLSTTPKSWSGSLSASTTKRWSDTQTAVTSSSTGCRTSGATSYEHAFRFKINSATNPSGSGIKATLTTNFNGIVSIFGPVSSFTNVPQAQTSLAAAYGSTIQTCTNVNSTTSVVSGTNYAPGEYLVIVHGQSTGTVGNYTLQLELDPALQNNGNFTNAALNAAATSPTMTAASFSNTTLNGGGASAYGDFGNVSTTQGYTWAGTMSSSSTQRWKHGAVVTANDTSWGCRYPSSSRADSNYEQVFKVHLNSSAKFTLSDPLTTDMTGVLSVFGPISATWGLTTPASGASVTTPALAFNNGGAITTSTCVYPSSGSGYVGSTGVTATATGDYLVAVHTYDAWSQYATGNYNLTITPYAAAPYADFGTLNATAKFYPGTLSASTTQKWSATNVGYGSVPNGCRSNASSASYEHAFKFTLGSGGTLTATLNTNTGSSSFNGVLSIFGPISSASWSAAAPAVNNTVTNYGGTVATCTNVNATSGSITGTYAAGDYLLLVQGQDTGNAGNYSLSLTATTAPYAADSQNSLLNGTTTAVVADFGDVTSSGYYYQGSTASGTTKWSYSELGSASCRSSSATTTVDAVKEHVFKFNITAATNMKITLSNPNWNGSGSKDWNSVVSLFKSGGSDPSVGVAISNPSTCTQNSTGDSLITSTPLAIGTYYVVVHGDTDSNAGTYKLAIQPDLAVGTPTPVTTNSLNTTLDGSNVVNVPFIADFGTLSATPYSYSGSTASALSKWVGSDLSTNTAATGSTSAANGCRYSANSDTGEHVFKFTLSSSHYVNLTLTGSFDPVLSLFGPLSASPSVGVPVPTATTETCYHDSTHNGTATSGSASISGTFATGTYYVVVHEFADATTDNIPSALAGGAYTLKVDPNTPYTLSYRTVTTDNATAEAQTTVGATAVDLLTVNNYITTYNGTTSTLTSNKWTDAQIRSASSSGTGAATGCRASLFQDSGHEHLFKFTVSGSTALPLKIALSAPASTGLDGTVSVFNSGTQPPANTAVSGFLACSRIAGGSDATTGTYTAASGVITGTYAPGTYYLIVHAYNPGYGDYTLTLTDNSTTYTSSTVATNSAASGGSGPQTGVDIGTVDGSLITYTGTTTSAINKWTQAQVSAIGGTGCRATGNDAAQEHVLRFTVTTARRVAMRVTTSSSTFQPVLTLLGTSAPSVNTLLASSKACTHQGSTATTDNLVTAGYTAADGLITGTFTPGTYYLLVNGYTSANASGPYTLSVIDAEPENLGTADVGHRIQSDGDSSTITFNQWQGGDFQNDLNAVPYGGRYSAADRTPERIYKFTITGTTKTLTVGLTASFDSVLSVFNTLPTAVSAGGSQLTGLLETNRGTGNYNRSITRAFDPGTYYVMIQGYRANNVSVNPPAGTFTLSVGDNTWQTGLMACNSRGASSKIAAQYLTAGSYYLVLKSGAGTGLPLNYQYKLNIRRTFAQPFIACDHEGYGDGSRRSFIETELVGGKTYAIVVRGMKPSDKGTYGVIVRDMSAGTQPLGCANAAGYTTAPNNPNSFTADLQANRQYYVVVRSNSDQSVGQTDVRISHAATSMCAFNNVTFDAVGTSTGVSPYVPAKITTKLPAGDYYAVVKGNQNLLQSSIKIQTGTTAGIPDDRGRGRYQITFGDTTLATNNQQFNPPLWGTANSGGALQELQSRGIRVITVNSISQHGSSDLYMREQSKQISLFTGATDSYGYVKSSSANSLAKSGVYITLAKTGAGFTTDSQGKAQDLTGHKITIAGATNAANNGDFLITSTTSTTLTYVNSTGVAEASFPGTFTVSGTAIRKNIGSDGSGMGYAIVDAVAKFANAVQMDMSVRLSYAPDDPGSVSPFNRRFYFKARAVKAPAGTSNNCAAPVDSDGDGILDTHPACGPGATPRFEIQITNPAAGNPGDPAQCVGGSTPGATCSSSSDCGTGLCSPPYPKNVPLNPEGKGVACPTSYSPDGDCGGYLMTLQLVGKDRLSSAANPQIIDEIPVYVIPQQVFPDPSVVYPTEATYEQTVNSTGCMSNETPKWRALYWSDKLPHGTSVTWSMCARDTDTELAACTNADFVTVATVTPQDITCTTSAQCNNAFCNNPTGAMNAGSCEQAVGVPCSVSSDCGTGAVCSMGSCNYTSDPRPEHSGIDLSGASTKFNFKKRVRVRAVLHSSMDRSAAPTIYDYKLDYTCSKNE